MPFRIAVAHSMQDAIQATRIVDRLFEPHNRLVIVGALIVSYGSFFLGLVLLVGF